eukprot:g58853.t1
MRHTKFKVKQFVNQEVLMRHTKFKKYSMRHIYGENVTIFTPRDNMENCILCPVCHKHFAGCQCDLAQDWMEMLSRLAVANSVHQKILTWKGEGAQCSKIRL